MTSASTGFCHAAAQECSDFLSFARSRWAGRGCPGWCALEPCLPQGSPTRRGILSPSTNRGLDSPDGLDHVREVQAVAVLAHKATTWASTRSRISSWTLLPRPTLRSRGSSRSTPPSPPRREGFYWARSRPGDLRRCRNLHHAWPPELNTRDGGGPRAGQRWLSYLVRRRKVLLHCSGNELADERPIP